MFDAIPAQSPVIIVEDVSSNQPALFLGFLAAGSEADMARLEKRASELKLPVSRATNDKRDPEIMVMLPPGTDHRAGLQLYRDSLSGKFGNLRLEVMIITKEKADDGIDLGADTTAQKPSSIRLPSE